MEILKDPMHPETLGDFGEFRLIREIVLPMLAGVSSLGGLGDDTGGVPIPGTALDLVVTTDSAGEPLLFKIGVKDYTLLGWLSVVMSLSDMAAAGALPIGFVSCVEAEASVQVSDFSDVFKGLADACETFGIVNAGGNLRAGAGVACHGTAFGVLERNRRLRRSGCRPGDFIAAVGESGLFAAAYLSAKEVGLHHLDQSLRQALERPVPKVAEMHKLNMSNLVSAASDCSDGVLGALWNIAEASEVGMELLLDDSIIDNRVRKAAERAETDPWNLMFFWGDWQVICSVSPGNWNQTAKIASRAGFPLVRLGRATSGPAELLYKRGTESGKLRLLRNESFSQTSYAGGGKDAAERLLYTPLYQ